MIRIPVRSLAVAVSSLVPVNLAAATTSAPQGSTAPMTVVRISATDPMRYSEPTYLPLRVPARVSCVKTNCRLSNGRIYHGNWAIDFIGNFGAPIYAAGYGVVHVGGRVAGCRDTAEARGNWVWIDHGGGEITRYYHFRKILINDAQAVTPDTQIGEMGGTGAASCKVPYLHFERRITNQTSQLVEPLTMWACVSGRPTAYPQADGYSTWNMPKLQEWVQSSGTSCLKRPPRASRPTLVSARANGARDGLNMAWRAPTQNPQLVAHYRLYVSLWHPSTNAWDAPVYYSVPGNATAFTVPRLQARRTYRVKVAAADRAGASPWSASLDVVIAKPPAPPPIARLEVTKRTILAKWKIPQNGGNKITSYRAELLRGTVVVRTSKLSPKVREVTWTGLRGKTRFTLRVAAVNQAGSSPKAVRRVATK